MNDIDRLSHILSTIRNATSRKTSKQAETTRSSESTKHSGKRERASVSDDALLDGLKSQVAQSLLRLNLDTPADQRTARKLFVESVLLWELGPEFADHKSFNRVVAEVTDTFAGDPSLKSDIDDLLRQLAG